jgi:hypothetical protein
MVGLEIQLAAGLGKRASMRVLFRTFGVPLVSVKLCVINFALVYELVDGVAEFGWEAEKR